jgi:hypothetical protein
MVVVVPAQRQGSGDLLTAIDPALGHGAIVTAALAGKTGFARDQPQVPAPSESGERPPSAEVVCASAPAQGTLGGDIGPVQGQTLGAGGLLCGAVCACGGGPSDPAIKMKGFQCRTLT